MTGSGPHLSAYELDLALSEGATDELRARVAEHTRACEACRADLETAREAYETFRREVLPRTLPTLRERAQKMPAESRPRFFARPWLWIPALAAGTVAVALPSVLLFRSVNNDPGAAWSVKGVPELLVAAEVDGQVVMLDRYRREVHPGDRVRFVLSSTPAGHPYVIIAAVDGRGQASVYFPYDGARSAAVAQPGRWEVPGAIALDDALGPERVFAVFSRQPLEAAVVRRALLALAARGANAIRDVETLDLADTVQSSFLLAKQAR